MKSENTSGAAKAALKNAPNMKPENMSVERALSTAQDIVRFCAASGIPARSGNARGGVVIFLPGVFQCPKCQNYSLGDVCQKCEPVPENEPEGVPEAEL